MNLLFDERLGILIGSLLSGVMGYLALRVFTTAVLWAATVSLVVWEGLRATAPGGRPRPAPIHSRP